MSVFIRMMIAKLGGYFWVPCPICGELFGGFEVGNGRVRMPDGTDKICCKNCDYEAGKIAGINGTDNFLTPEAYKFLSK